MSDTAVIHSCQKRTNHDTVYICGRPDSFLIVRGRRHVWPFFAFLYPTTSSYFEGVSAFFNSWLQLVWPVTTHTSKWIRAASVKPSPKHSLASQLKRRHSHARENPTLCSEQPKEISENGRDKKANILTRGLNKMTQFSSSSWSWSDWLWHE